MSKLVEYAKNSLNTKTQDYDIELDLIDQEFPDFAIRVSLSLEQLKQLDTPSIYKIVYIDDDRLPDMIKIPHDYPTFRQIINYLETVYNQEILEDHCFLEIFTIRYENADRCVMDMFWGS